MRRVWTAVVLGSVLMTGCERGSHPGNIGKPAPQFTMSDGVTAVDLSKLRGQVVVLNLWASWCVPCVEELPSLLAMQQQLPNVKVVAVSMDQDDDVYRRFLVKNNVHVTTVRDPDAKVNAIYGTQQIPETYIIDRQGILRRKFVNAQNWTSPEIIGYLSRL
ncbi:TlpA family protein disulfide reductase [Granulicella arctica]|uniref:TlpA family protein disulfide reductase n=1 Tax=Granulicella arctica TaxID=940613 RepID=UPI0021E00256|nr:TlpA disulfide reductase family protein [Granulicella arctica]